MLKAAEPEELEAYRLLLRRQEPVSTVTTVSKLVDLLATTVLVISWTLTDFERRVTSWEHEAKETLSDLIEIGVVTKGLEKGGFRDHLLIKTAGTAEWTKFVKQIENVELARRNTELVPMDLSAMGSQDHKVPRSLFMVWNLRPHARDCRKNTGYLQNNPTGGWSGTDDTTKGKPVRAKANKTEAREKASPVTVRAKARARAKERANNTARK